jgi:hypothetical protein
MTGTRSRGRSSQGCPPSDDPAGAPARDVDAAGRATWVPAMPVAFYGRVARAAGTGDSQANRQQLALCRAVVALYGSQVNPWPSGESCRRAAAGQSRDREPR